MATILRSHIQSDEYRKSAILSLVGHSLVLLLFTVGVSLLPEAEPIQIGLGQGGGQSGDFVSVGLTAEVGGGEGMYKSPITRRSDFIPPEETRAEEVEEEPAPEEPVFEESKAPPKEEKKVEEPPRRPPPKQEKPPEPKAGRIRREVEAGKGESTGSAGSGGGLGSGRGVTVGSGTGAEGSIDSWYIRQVEQRVGQNWLQTSLGRLERRVTAVASFIVQQNGQITDIGLEQSSGISSVDLAVQRAIQATNPLPRLPYELRGRTVRFQAIFEYPPR